MVTTHSQGNECTIPGTKQPASSTFVAEIGSATKAPGSMRIL